LNARHAGLLQRPQFALEARLIREEVAAADRSGERRRSRDG
jgi:hypothetical protein